MNMVRVGSFFAVAWTNVCGLLDAGYNTKVDRGLIFTQMPVIKLTGQTVQHVWISIANYVGIVVMFMAGALLVGRRCQHIEQVHVRI